MGYKSGREFSEKEETPTQQMRGVGESRVPSGVGSIQCFWSKCT